MDSTDLTKTEPAIQVHLVRHGEVYNPSGVLYGRAAGYHLSKTGQAMAERLGEYFAPIALNQLRCSPLERAQETLVPIAARHPELEIRIDERLIEAENKFAGQVFGKYNAALLNPRNWRFFVNPMLPSWGEPYLVLAGRMQEVIWETVGELPAGGQAVLVSHQSPIWTARLAFEGRGFLHDPRKRQCSLASVTTFRFTDGQFSGTTYAEPALDLLGKDGNKAFSSGD